MHLKTDTIGVHIQTDQNGVLVRCAPGEVLDAIEWKEARLLASERVTAVSVRRIEELKDTGPVDFTDRDFDSEYRDWQDGLDDIKQRNKSTYGREY